MSTRPTTLDEVPRPGTPARLELTSWRERFGIVAGITARDGERNWGLGTPTPATDVLAAWRSFFGAMQPQFRRFALGLQVHGTRIVRHDDPGEGWTILDGVDGHLTAVPGTLLLVTAADCIPVYLTHPGSRTVALVHAGWRGVASGIVDEAIAELISATDAAVEELVIHCGVGICGDCYQVGPEVVEAIAGRKSGGREHLDLRATIAARARRAGVGEVTVSGWCTAHHAERFHSHRRSGGTDGRMAAYLGVPAP